MTAVEHRQYSFNASFILLIASLLAFIAAFCVAEAWLNLGLWQEWVAAGLALHVLAEVA